MFLLANQYTCISEKIVVSYALQWISLGAQTLNYEYLKRRKNKHGLCRIKQKPILFSKPNLEAILAPYTACRLKEHCGQELDVCVKILFSIKPNF